MRPSGLELGTLDVCLRVANYPRSRDFYGQLGFAVAETGEGWGVVTNGQSRIGLFELQFMDADDMSLNFRGGPVEAIKGHLDELGIECDYRASARGKSLRLRDPDGLLLFFDAES